MTEKETIHNQQHLHQSMDTSIINTISDMNSSTVSCNTSFSLVGINDIQSMELSDIGELVSEDCVNLSNHHVSNNNVLTSLSNSTSISSNVANLSIQNGHNFISPELDPWCEQDCQDIVLNNMTMSSSHSITSSQEQITSSATMDNEDLSSLLEDQLTYGNLHSDLSEAQDRNNFGSFHANEKITASMNDSGPCITSYAILTNTNAVDTGNQPIGNSCESHYFINQTPTAPYPANIGLEKPEVMDRCLVDYANPAYTVPQDFSLQNYIPNQSASNHIYLKHHDVNNNPYPQESEIAQERSFSSSSGSRNTSNDTDVSESLHNEAKEELRAKPQGKRTTSKKTMYNEKWGIKVLNAWCAHKNIHISFCDITPEEMNNLLINFWQTLQKASGGKYGRNSLFNLRAMINKFIKGIRTSVPFDIVTDGRFRTSNDILERELDILAKTGRTIKNKIPISLEHMWQLYRSRTLGTDTPEALVRKVWFEITLYFNRRGSTPQDKLRRNSFIICRDRDGRRFLERRDCKERNGRNEAVRMYETGDYLCPIRSYERYLSKLHPQQQRLFQQPRKKLPKRGEVWFGKAPIGEKALQSMMGTISEAANLPVRYTNHCVRTTPAIQHQDMMKRHVSGKNPVEPSDETTDVQLNFYKPVTQLPSINGREGIQLTEYSNKCEALSGDTSPTSVGYFSNPNGKLWPTNDTDHFARKPPINEEFQTYAPVEYCPKQSEITWEATNITAQAAKNSSTGELQGFLEPWRIDERFNTQHANLNFSWMQPPVCDLQRECAPLVNLDE